MSERAADAHLKPGSKPPGSIPDSAELIAAARAMIPRLRERAGEADRERRLPPETYKELTDAGLLNILKPKAYGGYEMGPHEHAMVTLELARGCASTAWVYSLLNSDHLFLLSYPKQAQDDVWAKDHDATLAGSIVLDRAKAQARRVDGGYRLTGSFGFNSGSDFADWLIFNAAVGDEEPSLLFLVPKGDCAMVDDWFTLGMRGTGSRTYRVDDLFVPAHRAIPATELHGSARHLSLHPDFDLIQCRNALAGLHLFSAVVVGAALGAVDYVVENAGGIRRQANNLGGDARLVESGAVLAKFSESAAEAELARFRIEHGSRLASERVRRRETPTAEERLRETRDNSYLGIVAMRCVDRLHALLGAKANFEGHPVQRAMRDIHTAVTHVTMNWDRISLIYARETLGVEVSPSTR